MLCWFLPQNNTNQSQRYIYPLPLATAPHPHQPITPLGHQRVLGWAPCVLALPSSSLCSTHGSVCISVLLFQFIPLSFPSVSTVFSLRLHLYSWMDLEFVIQNEKSHKEKSKYLILMHIYIYTYIYTHTHMKSRKKYYKLSHFSPV